MTPARREELLAAARGLGPEEFNRLAESAGAARQVGRLRYWQEELLARLPVKVSFEEFVEAFEGAPPMPASRRAAPDPEDAPEPGLHHPRLGGLHRDDEEGYWEGAARLPRFAAAGEAQRDEDDPPAGYVRVRIEDPDGAGVSPQQDAAIAHLLDREQEAFDAVCRELGATLESDDAADAVCTVVEVSRLHLGGLAYLGFFLPDIDPEHGFMVVYHPAKGTSSGDWEALHDIEEADNS